MSSSPAITVDDVLSREKFLLFTMKLTAEELEQLSLCRRGILGAMGIGGLFGVFGGKMAIGPAPASLLLKSSVIGGKPRKNCLCFINVVVASVLTGLIIGAGVSVQQSFSYLKSKPTNLSKELTSYS